jgi:hypothetical protein
MWGLVFSVGKFVVPLLIAGGAYLWITTAAYNRGVAATEAKTVKIIAEEKGAVMKDAEVHRGMNEDQLNEELRKKCLEAGGTEEKCK